MAPKMQKPKAKGAPKAKAVVKQCSPCTVWSVTAWCSQVGEDPHQFYMKMKPYFKSGTWQLEEAPTTGAKHFQGKFSLFKKMRAGPDSTALAKELGFAYFQPSSNDNLESHAYEQKANSRVAGPWTIAAPPMLRVSDVSYIEENLHKLPFARDLIARIKGPICPRTIIWIVAPGKDSKSALQAYMQYHGLIEVLPFVRDHKDLLQFAYGFCHKRAYCVNVPAGCSHRTEKDRLDFVAFIAGLESLKDGFTYDLRHYAKKEQMERPHVVAMGNCEPILDAATPDRWCIFTIDSEMRFVDITQECWDRHNARNALCRKVHLEKRLSKEQKHFEMWVKLHSANPSVRETYDLTIDKWQTAKEERANFQSKRAAHFEALNGPLDKKLKSVDDTSCPASSSSEHLTLGLEPIPIGTMDSMIANCTSVKEEIESTVPHCSSDPYEVFCDFSTLCTDSE